MPPNVKIRLEVEGTPEAVARFRQVRGEAKQLQDSIQKTSGFPGLAKGLVGVAGVLGVATTAVAAVQQVLQTVRESQELAEQLSNRAEIFRSTVGTILPLALEAKKTNVEFEDLATRTGRLAQKLVDLKGGKDEAVALFSALNLGAKDFRGEDLGQHMQTVLRAIGGLEDGYRKVALAQATFGKGGENLIPLANRLAREGVDPLAQRIATLFGPKQLADAQAFRDSLNLLDLSVKAIAFNLPAELLPGLDQTIRGIATALLELAAAARQVDAALPVVSTTLSALGKLSLGVFRLATNEVRRLAADTKLSINDVVNQYKILTDKTFTWQQKLANSNREDQRIEDEAYWQRVKDIWKGLPATPPPSTARALVPPGSPDPPDKRRTAKAAAAERESQAYKLLLDTWEKLDAQHYQQGLISLKEYFARRSAIIDLGAFDEIEKLQKKLAAVQGDRGLVPADRARRSRDLEEQITEVRRRAAGERVALHTEELREIEGLQKKRLGFEEELSKIQLDQHEQRLAQIHAQRAEYEATLRQGMGLPGFPTSEAEVNARGFGYEAGLGSVEIFNEQLENAVRLKDEFAKGDYVSAAQQAQLGALVENLRAMALTLGPDQREQVEDLAASFEDLGQRGSVFVDELRSSLTSFLATIGTQFRSATDAGYGLLLMLAQLAAQWAATQLVNTLLPVKKAGGGAVTGHAGGGRVFGPGTWTSDSIPALLSRDEQVTRAVIASMSGVRPYLDRLNAGEPGAIALAQAYSGARGLAGGGRVSQSMVRPVYPLALAGGGRAGSVTPARGGAEFSGQLVVDLPAGASLRPSSEVVVRGPDGDRYVLEVIARNRNAISRLTSS